MSYNREIRDGVGDLNGQMKELASNLGTLTTLILKHSEFIERAYKDEQEALKKRVEAEQEAAKNAKQAAEEEKKNAENAAKEAAKRKEIADLNAEYNQKVRSLDARQLEFEQNKLSSSEARNRREAEQIDAHNKAIEDSFARERELLKQEDELRKIKEDIVNAKTDKEKEDLKLQLLATQAKFDQLNENEKFRQKLDGQRADLLKSIKSFGEVLKEQVVKIPEQIISTILDMQTKAVTSVANVYQQHAGKLSALLDSSVSDISQMQKNIANQLRTTGLNGAISNVQVLEEASKLASAGYTNEAKLQQTATDISIARQISPALDLDNKTVKNLTNVFGSDFIIKFAGITSAVQDSAGSLAAVQSTLGSLMTDLEPVFLNAELQATALQSTSDVEATLSDLQERGVIGESEVAQYRSMLVELMDPTKALTSNNVAVRVAAHDLYNRPDYEAGNLAQALEAIFGSTSDIMNRVGQSNSAQDIIARGYYAKAMGVNTMTAEYNNKAYTDTSMTYTGDIGTSYQEQVDKLENSAYTTKQTEEENKLENADVTQTIAGFAKEFPQTYKMMSAAIIAAINTAGSGLTARLTNGLFGSGGGGGGHATGDAGSTGGLIGKLSKATTTSGGHQFIGSRGFGLISANNAADSAKWWPKFASSGAGHLLGTNLSGMGMLAVGAFGVSESVKMAQFAGAEENKDLTWAQKHSYNGDYAKAAQAGAGIGAMGGMAVGAAIGALGGPIGSAAGAAIGALIGIGGSLITAFVANKEAAEQQKEAMEAQTQATKDLLGQGIKPLSELEKAKANQGGRATIAIGNDNYALADFSASDYASVMSSNAGGLDFVPFDNYVARLHKGEAVVTAKAAEEYRQSNPQFWRDARSSDRVVDKLDEQTSKIVSALNKDIKPKPISSGAMFAPTYVIPNLGV